MSWELESRLRHAWVRHALKKENFLIKCLYCNERHSYITIDNFIKHLEEVHNKFYKYEEEENSRNSLWKYFRLTKLNNIQCVICDKPDLKYNYLFEHVKAHLMQKEGLEEIRTHWCWKYLEEIENKDFSAKCNLCEHSVTLEMAANLFIRHLRHKHINIHELRSRKCSILENVQSWEYLVQQNIWIKKYFTIHEMYFLANCNYCNTNIEYAKDITLEKHMKDKHKAIYRLENQKDKIKSENWRAMKYTNGVAYEIKCMICDIVIDESSEKNHVQHTAEELTDYTWPFKYIIKEGDFAVCEICGNVVNLYFEIGSLSDHISNCCELPQSAKDALEQEWQQEMEAEMEEEEFEIEFDSDSSGLSD